MRSTPELGLVLWPAVVASARLLWQSPLFRVAASWASLALSPCTGCYGLAGHLGYELEDFVFGVSRSRRGSFAVY